MRLVNVDKGDVSLAFPQFPAQYACYLYNKHCIDIVFILY